MPLSLKKVQNLEKQVSEIKNIHSKNKESTVTPLIRPWQNRGETKVSNPQQQQQTPALKVLLDGLKKESGKAHNPLNKILTAALLVQQIQKDTQDWLNQITIKPKIKIPIPKIFTIKSNNNDFK